MTPLLRIKDISKTYVSQTEETVAIEGFSLDVREGEFVSLVGPSGCGKSTLLSIIAGLLEPSSGACEFSRPVLKGYMLQRDHLFGWRTILKNAMLGLEVKGESTPQNKAYVRGLLTTYGLGDFMNAYPDQLSGGMRQRAALIRTLAIRPDILLLDEPFSALDYQTRFAVGDDIAGIIEKEQKTAMLITHDLNEAVAFSDRVVVLSERPARIKNVYEIDIPDTARTRASRQGTAAFARYHEKIWKDLDVHEG